MSTRFQISLAALVVISAGVALGCAASKSGDPRYPRRAAGCELAVYHTPVPGVAAWDDLGLAEAACNITMPVAECLRMLRAEACRLGGDILYNVPRNPYRPRDRVMVFRGQVAHTRSATAKRADAQEGEHQPDKSGNDDEAPPAASAEEAAGPVVPLPSAHPPGGPTGDQQPPAASGEKAPTK